MFSHPLNHLVLTQSNGGNSYPNGEIDLQRESDEFIVTWVVNGGVRNVGRCKASPGRGVFFF